MSGHEVTVAEGVGKLFGSSVLLREVLYRLTRAVDDTGMVRPSEATGPVEGVMDVGDVAEAVVIAGVDDLALELDDGRRFAIALCSTGGRVVVHGVPPVPDGHRDFATRYTAAWCSQDPSRVASFFAREGSLTVNGGAPAVGREQIADVARGFMTAVPDLRVLMDDVVDLGEHAIYQWTLIGTHGGPGGTGRAVRISGHEEWRLSPEGLIAVSAGRFDVEDYKRQLG